MATNNAINTPNPINVQNGGFGRATLTNHGVLVGAGTSAITQLAVGTNGMLLVASSAADPVFVAPTSTLSSLTYTNGAGTKNIDITSWADKVSFTPSMTFGGAATGWTFTTSGTYCRAGKVIWAIVSIEVTAKGSSTGTVLITGWPFVFNTATAQGCVASSYSNLIFTQDNIGSSTIPTTTTDSVTGTVGATGVITQFTDVNFVVGTIVKQSIIYFTN